MPILSTVSRNEQANVVGNAHGSAEGNPRLALQIYERLRAGSMTASWCESEYRSEEHCMVSGTKAIRREMDRCKGWRTNETGSTGLNTCSQSVGP